VPPLHPELRPDGVKFTAIYLTPEELQDSLADNGRKSISNISIGGASRLIHGGGRERRAAIGSASGKRREAMASRELPAGLPQPSLPAG